MDGGGMVVVIFDSSCFLSSYAAYISKLSYNTFKPLLIQTSCIITMLLLT